VDGVVGGTPFRLVGWWWWWWWRCSKADSSIARFVSTGGALRLQQTAALVNGQSCDLALSNRLAGDLIKHEASATIGGPAQARAVCDCVALCATEPVDIVAAAVVILADARLGRRAHRGARRW
jgi:hypothetical protein